MTQTALKSLAARAGWTAVQAALGVLTIALTTNVPSEVWYVTLIATALSAVKSFVASKVGDPNTVKFDTAPASADPQI